MADRNGSERQDTEQPAAAERHGERRTSRLAAWSFGLSFFAFFFPALVLSVILGLMGRKEIERSPRRLKGHGLATAGVVISMAWFVVLAAFFFHGNILPQILTAQRERLSERCSANLSAVASAIESYRADHENTFPPDLQALADGGYIEVEKLRCPCADGPFDPSRVDETGGYSYRPFAPPAAPTVPLAWDSEPRHGNPDSPRANVLYLGGRVESVPAFELEEVLSSGND